MKQIQLNSTFHIGAYHIMRNVLENEEKWEEASK